MAREDGQQGLSCRVGDSATLGGGVVRSFCMVALPCLWGGLCLVLTWFDFLFESASPNPSRPDMAFRSLCVWGVLYHPVSYSFLWQWLLTVTLVFKMMFFT